MVSHRCRENGGEVFKIWLKGEGGESIHVGAYEGLSRNGQISY